MEVINNISDSIMTLLTAILYRAIITCLYFVGVLKGVLRIHEECFVWNELQSQSCEVAMEVG